jgi:phosphohistidine swiveling domain-containing protein
MNEDKFVYFFGAGQAEGGSDLKHLVGGKGASLADMTRAGLQVPPGFTISAACCDLYYRNDRHWPAGLNEAVAAGMARLEQLVGRSFGRGDNPLLVAVRSGAAQSMPGMMDTVLNVGLHPDCVRVIAARTGNPRAAWDAYRHFLGMFGHTVGHVAEAVFTDLLADLLGESGIKDEEELDARQLEMLCDRYRQAYRQHTGRDLPTEPGDMLRQAIDAVFGSWNNERAVTYRRLHGIEGLLGTAVNVQMMCPSEVSGVLFTANPVNPALEQIVIESSYGLGEAIVLGKVTPDRFVVSRQDGRIVQRAVSNKVRVIATIAQHGAGQAGPRDRASLDDTQVQELAQLGLRVEQYYHVPCDIEWGLSQGRFYLLQARPIKGIKTAADDAEREKVRQEEIAALQALAEPTGTVWSRYNLAEILPEPTPLTWAIVRRFMSGQGGFGLMYRDLGFDPDPALDEAGIFDLVCGRPYCNLSREPRMQYRTLPFEHPFAALKAEPRKALYPVPVFNPNRAGWRFWLLLPVLFVRLFRSALRLRRVSRTFAERFRKEVLPPFLEETARAAKEDLTKLDTAALLERSNYWIQRTLFDFARESLKPTALAGLAMGNLERALARLKLTPEQTPAAAEQVQATLRELVMGVHPDPDADLPGAVRDLAAGKLDRATFLERFGHRGSQEMELAQPRWSEQPEALASASGGRKPPDLDLSGGLRPPLAAPLDRYAIPAALRPGLEVEVQTLHTYLSLRETAKHHLMRGYALIRRYLVELDHRCCLEGGIFFLLPEELPRLTEGAAVREELQAVIAQRRRRRQLALGLPLPQVLFSDDLEAVGRPLEVSGADALQGVPLSAGTAEGPALVLSQPQQDGLPDDPYILVCPSTDPAWYPLFLKARGLVMETGGVLSHGAIAARELGLPAVAGLPEVHRHVRTGQRLHIDGSTGRVNLLASAE